ncbi:MAG: VWA domain-containing protein, partial [Acidobacteriota bacterium]|nr:VWA domain-containing protein [Acidobacteriota bacterium]
RPWRGRSDRSVQTPRGVPFSDMFFLNLTTAEFFTLLGALGGLITALYLLDRAKRRKIVSTLHFWVQAGASDQHQARRRMREPWSLVLQLASLLLLLLAISRVQWGGRDRRAHDHVLLLDTSSWTAARVAADPTSTVLDREKDLARHFLSALPPGDRVMLVAAGGLATPLTRFTQERPELTAALKAAVSGLSALNIDTVLSFAHQAQSWSGGAPGEIVYLGPQLVGDNPVSLAAPDRILAVPADRENCGIRQLSVQEVEDEANTWHAMVTVKNYGVRSQVLRLDTRYASTAFAARRLSIPPNGEATAEYTFTTRTPGELVAAIIPGGSLASDDRASLYLPRNQILRVAVYTDRAQDLRPLLEANHQLNATFFSPSQYSPRPAADITVLDRFAPAVTPSLPSLWIDPPPEHSPLPIKSAITDSLLVWTLNSPSKKLLVHAANTFQTFEGDEVAAGAPEGPVIVVRNGSQTHSKSAVIGFDPVQGELRFEVATPLLFAGLLQWLDPAAFQTLSLTAGQIGLASVDLDGAEQHSSVRVTDESGFALPSAKRGNSLQFFAASPAVVHVTSGERERIVSLTLPGVAGKMWSPGGAPSTGLPSAPRFAPPALDIWQWLVLAAALCLLIEWLLFGRATLGRKLRPIPASRENNTVSGDGRGRSREFAAK